VRDHDTAAINDVEDAEPASASRNKQSQEDHPCRKALLAREGARVVDVLSSVATVVPSEYPEVEHRPALREMLRRQVDMQFIDLATLLELPRPDAGLHAGTNLTTTVLLCNIVSGASVLFFKPSLDAIRGRRTDANPMTAGQRFREVLAFFPWEDSSDVPRHDAVRALYKYARNPLAHSLGVGKAPALLPGIRGRNVMLAKRPLSPEAAAEIMRGEAVRPTWSDMPIFTTDDAGYVISVEGLAWGVCRMVRSLFNSEEHGAAADATADVLLGGSGSWI
jgi:hypothetical protein